MVLRLGNWQLFLRAPFYLSCGYWPHSKPFIIFRWWSLGYLSIRYLYPKPIENAAYLRDLAAISTPFKKVYKGRFSFSPETTTHSYRKPAASRIP